MVRKQQGEGVQKQTVPAASGCCSTRYRDDLIVQHHQNLPLPFLLPATHLVQCLLFVAQALCIIFWLPLNWIQQCDKKKTQTKKTNNKPRTTTTTTPPKKTPKPQAISAVTPATSGGSLSDLMRTKRVQQANIGHRQKQRRKEEVVRPVRPHSFRNPDTSNFLSSSVISAVYPY